MEMGGEELEKIREDFQKLLEDRRSLDEITRRLLTVGEVGELEDCAQILMKRLSPTTAAKFVYGVLYILYLGQQTTKVSFAEAIFASMCTLLAEREEKR